MTVHPFFPILLVSVLISCQASVKQHLDLAEAYMDTRPDSSLAILQSIGKDELRTKRLQARHALLTSMALDKNYIDVTDDSIISKAVSFYSRKKASNELMKSWYYQAIVNKNAGNYPAAIVSLEMAERAATEKKNYHLLGLIYRNKADIFSLTNNTSDALVFYKKSVEAFEANGDSLYSVYGKYSLAASYLNNREIEASINQLKELQRMNLSPSLRIRSNLCYACNLVEQGDSLGKAILIFKQTPESHFHVLDYGLYAVALYNTGHKDSAQYWFEKGYAAFNNREMKASLEYLHSTIAYKTGDYKLAYQLEDNALHVQDSLTRVLLQQSLNNAQRDYYRAQMLLQEGIIKRQRYGIIYGCCFAILLLSIFFLFGRQRRQKADSLAKEQMAQLTLRQENTIQSNAILVGAFVKEKMMRLYHLSEDYFKEEDPTLKEHSFSEFKKSLRELRKNDGFYQSLEVDLNRYCNGVFDKLLNQVPEIRGDNRRLAALFFSGLPGEWIQILGDKHSAGSVRTSRSRLRSIIKDAHAADENTFLEMLETRKQS